MFARKFYFNNNNNSVLAVKLNELISLEYDELNGAIFLVISSCRDMFDFSRVPKTILLSFIEINSEDFKNFAHSKPLNRTEI